MTTSASVPRRGLFKAGLAASAAVLTPAVTTSSASAQTSHQLRSVESELRELEQRYVARLGVYARNVRTGQVVSHRARERFAMCSTFKAVAAAAVLRAHGHCSPLDKVIHYPPADLLPNSPRTEAHVDTGMSVADLCAAAIQYSDNTAGNLLLREIGGPAGLTGFFRSIGDRVSRLDRWETDLNTAVPGDLRDTTTPAAIGGCVERLALGRALADADRERLVTWLKGNTTSGQRFRAGLPGDWVVADKTGTGDYATANDIGVAWTTRRTPLVLAVLSSKTTRDAPVDNALIESAARILAHALAPGE
ncbi:class A beta-lactamase [Streptomyces sp. HUAS TT20]|uniref:class A beta-lactamase n=1 Tax=Streptomyces sp. HUAS TT20 TaxID=3447509 RepID=UPI0021DB74F4|nr:class A beta-lactamase [Streptomyces sp. HUAS 15-9]UXY31625.1 class A beta-lactamase [Streptomyces sp. HUAS 15-9]